jgi:hypothetical protein
MSPISPIRRSVLVLSFFVAAAATAGCSPNPQVQTNSANVAGVARYKTYLIEITDSPPAGYRPAARSRNVLEMARPKIEAAMGKKGYTASAGAEADLIVRVSAGVRTVVDQPTGTAAIDGAPSETDEVSTLVINIIDMKSKEKLFEGAAKKEIHSRQVKDEDVAFAVTQMLDPVPASASSAR